LAYHVSDVGTNANGVMGLGNFMEIPNFIDFAYEDGHIHVL